MDALFLNLANIIKEQPMPQEFQDVRSVIFCNDCSAKCSTPYHFLGLRCQICQSFNTMELDRSPMPGDRADGERNAVHAGPSRPGSPSQPSNSTDGRHDDPLSSPVLHSPCSRASASNGAIQNSGSPAGNPRFVEPEMDFEDEEDEELNFWGGEVRSGSSADESESEGDMDDSEVEEEDKDEEGDEEDDNDDGDIILLGHR